MSDLYQDVTQKIITALEHGVMPWIKPWTAPSGHRPQPYPVNAVSGRAYSGINIPLLWAEAQQQGFLADRWLTFNQARQAGGHIRKGERSTLTVLYKPMERDAQDASGNSLVDDAGDPQKVRFALLKTHFLFNIEQTEGLQAMFDPEPVQDQSAFDANACAEGLLQRSGARIVHRPGDQAFYSPVRDLIQLPNKAQFASEAGYYATALHELTHWTGHPSRLQRDAVTTPTTFGSEPYAFEELIAEMGAAFLCAHAGIEGELRHEGYIDAWLAILKADKKAIFRASGKAREASEYLLALSAWAS